MNKLGDVVFCVDCDLEHEAHKQTAQPEGADSASEDEHPRRMATKKDANGDPLCTQCLDERQARRRKEFMLGDERRTVVHWPRRGRASDPKPALMSAAVAEASEKPASNGVKLQRSQSKAAFVRSLPAGTPAKDVIAEASKQGIHLTPAYVYVIRSTDGARKGGGTPAARSALPKSNGHLLDRRALRVPKANDRGIERKFRWLAVELGFHRTEQLLHELKTKIRVVFAS